MNDHLGSPHKAHAREGLRHGIDMSGRCPLSIRAIVSVSLSALGLVALFLFFISNARGRRDASRARSRRYRGRRAMCSHRGDHVEATGHDRVGVTASRSLV